MKIDNKKIAALKTALTNAEKQLRITSDAEMAAFDALTSSRKNETAVAKRKWKAAENAMNKASARVDAAETALIKYLVAPAGRTLSDIVVRCFNDRL